MKTDEIRCPAKTAPVTVAGQLETRFGTAGRWPAHRPCGPLPTRQGIRPGNPREPRCVLSWAEGIGRMAVLRRHRE
ncbi:hypothetical protein GCM10022222_71850 [Amycolatopsis ultiminotia]|uniref:Uncharacterized protein n=1 Tax=Amycolatopsis ultiminotia TaxID=543629 RepID=A0ABP6Y4I5_9PSEU